MAGIPESIVDTLNGLLEAEVNSVFRHVGEGSPYVAKADMTVQKSLAEMDKLSHRHSKELADLITSLGGTPRVRNRVRPEDQHISFLSLKFLIPKLVAEKDLILTRYENARSRIADHPRVLEMITRIESEQKQWLDVLGRAATDVTGGKYTPPVHKAGDE